MSSFIRIFELRSKILTFEKSQINLDFCSLNRIFAPMELKTVLINAAKIIFPVLLGGAILYWMYRGEDFGRFFHVMTQEMDWTWMLLSFPFGILAQMFRGWRWKQTLEPLGESPRTSTSIYAIFLSYAVSLVIPRIGEFTRCGVLKRYEGISFSKALGTVVTERAVDTLIVMGYSCLILLVEMSIFGTFFQKTGTSLDHILDRFSSTGYLVTVICAVAVLILLHLLLKNFSIYNKVKMTLSGIWEGVLSLRGVKNLPLYLFFLLPHVLLLRLHSPLGYRLCPRVVCRGQLRRHRTDPQRCRSLALCHQDHADPLWCRRRTGPLVCTHRPYRPDHACYRSWHLCLGSPVVYKKT